MRRLSELQKPFLARSSDASSSTPLAARWIGRIGIGRRAIAALALSLACGLLQAPVASGQTVLLNEGFDSVADALTAGWTVQNVSLNPGIATWGQAVGTPVGPFDSFDGGATAFAFANYNSATAHGIISNWLIAPPVAFERTSELSFYTRINNAGQVWPDRLQIRLCRKVTCALPTDHTSVGDFDTLLRDINPNENGTDYPRNWTKITITNLPRHGSGRIAFRYYVSNDAGPDGTKSDYIGLDRVVLTASGGPAYRVGGTVSGLAGSGLTLRLNGGTPRPVAANGAFELPEDLDEAAAYAVTVEGQPQAPAQQCGVTSGSGTISGADITNVAVSCVTLVTVTPSAAAHGAITPDVPQFALPGATLPFLLTPDPHYVTGPVGGTCGGLLSGSTFTTTPISADCTVAASFTRDSHTLTASAGPNGSISPASRTLTHGDPFTFTVLADPNHHIVDVTGCDGTRVGGAYTIASVTADCSVTATFAIDTHQVTASAGAGGTITPAGPQAVDHGDTRAFTVTPDAHHHLVSITGCGGTLVETTFTTAPVVGACDVTAAFVIDSYAMTATATSGGAITPAGSQTVDHGDVRAFTLTPDPMFTLANVTGCDGTLVDHAYTSAPATADCAITATFERAIFTRYFAEGAAGGFFATRVALFNPDASSAAAVTLTLVGGNGQERAITRTVPALRRVTVTLDDAAELPHSTFAIRIESDRVIAADRLMTWGFATDPDGGYGSSLETATDAPGTDWYLAEGATGGPFALYYLLQNPGDVETTATVRYLLASPTPGAPMAPIDKTYPLAPRSRTTIDVAGEAPLLAAAEVSAHITATQPIVVERAMYRSTPSQPLAAGHAGLAIAAPATRWFIAEGATGFFDEFVLLANATDAAAAVTVTYLPEGQAAFAESFTVDAHSRYTLELKRDPRLAATAVSLVVESTNTVPIVAERVMWWPAGAWYEASLSAGATRAATVWAIAETEQGGAHESQTYIAIMNTDAVSNAAVTVRLFCEDGTTAEQTIVLRAGERKTVDVGDTAFAAVAGKRFGAIVASSGPPIVVERSLYRSGHGRLWDSGASSIATIVQP